MLWAKSAGGNSRDRASSLKNDVSGNIILTGTFISPNIVFGSTTLTNVDGGFEEDILLVKYNSSGSVIWAKSAGGTDHDVAVSVYVATSGDCYVAGYFQSPTISFGSSIISNNGGWDILFLKFDSNGNELLAGSAGRNRDDKANSVYIDASGSILLAGCFSSDTIGFGSTILVNASVVNAKDLFITKLLSPSSVENLFKQENILIFPNPFNSSTNIYFGSIPNNVEVTIYNLIGVEVKSIKDISEEQIKIDRGNLPSGNYFLKIKQNNQALETTRLIVAD